MIETGCEWEDAGPWIDGRRSVRCKRCGQVTNPTPHPFEKIHATCRAGARDTSHLPGSILGAMLKAAAPTRKAGCGVCAEMVRKMNGWGAAGCREHRAEIIQQLKDSYDEMSALERLQAVAGFAVSGLAFSINPLDPFGSLVDEAIRRSELATADALRRSGEVSGS